MHQFPQGTDVVTLYHRETGEKLERLPVDAREMLQGALYVMEPPVPGQSSESTTSDIALVDGMSVAGAAVMVKAGYPTTASLRALSPEEGDRIEGLDDSDRQALRNWIAGGNARRAADPILRKPAAGVPAATVKPQGVK
jgi:hypothetical protein